VDVNLYLLLLKNNMNLSLDEIKNMNQKDRFRNRKSIRKFLLKASPSKLRQAQVILSEPQKEKYLKPHIRKNINKSFKVIKTKSFNSDSKTLHIIRKEFYGNNIDSGSKICRKCKELKFLSEFSHNANECKQCHGLHSLSYNIVILYGEGKECTQCLDFKKWEEFCYCNTTSDKKSIYCRECSSLNMKLRLQTNANLRFSFSLRNRINIVLKSNVKTTSTEELIGCSIDELRTRFERLFQSGMTWDNHGTGKNGKGMKEWHIDHIKPCSSFDLSKIEEQHKCFHYSNLQPLWAKDNLIKSDNY
jgi:hypothetical protein